MVEESSHIEEIERWFDRFKRHFKEVAINTLVAGIGVFIISHALLFLGIEFFPDFFVNYISPVFNSDGSRDILFYAHPFVLTHSLSILWNRFQKYFTGNFLRTGLEFGFMYSVVALLPILWITFAAMEVSFMMVFSWFLYGLVQSAIAGSFFALLRMKKIT
ncbi:MAG: hypothetical protein WAT79_04335 [Saprospiraceae bacterium]